MFPLVVEVSGAESSRANSPKHKRRVDVALQLFFWCRKPICFRLILQIHLLQQTRPSISLLFSLDCCLEAISVYVRQKTMKLVSRSLSRDFILARLVPSTRLPVSLATNTRFSSVFFTRNYRQLSTHTSTLTMPPPPKRKWPRGRGGGGGGDRSNGAPTTPGNPAAPRSTMGQQPKRPKVEDAQQKVDTVDVRQMYSTSAGDAAPKPFSDLKNKLHPALLEGLDKMGFE
jgi:hypothetical protein